MGTKMELTDLLMPLMFSALGIIGYFLKSTMNVVNATHTSLNEFKVEVARDYIHKNDLKDIITGLNERFDRIETKLDRMYEK